MPSTWSTRFRLNYQAPGDNLNAWGLILNQQVFQALEDAIAKRVAFSLSGTKTLTTENGVADEARSAFLDVTSGAGGSIVIPSVEKIYLVRNAASAAVVVTTGGGASVSVAPGSLVLVVCDAANVRLLRDNEMATRAWVEGMAFANVGDLPDVAGNAGRYVYSDGLAASWRQIVVGDVSGAAPLAAPEFPNGITVQSGLALFGSTKSNVVELEGMALDLAKGEFFRKSISTNTAFTFSSAEDSKGMAFVVELTIADGAIPTWPATVDWPGGAAPPLPNGAHLLGFITLNGGSSWRGILGGVSFS